MIDSIHLYTSPMRDILPTIPSIHLTSKRLAANKSHHSLLPDSSIPDYSIQLQFSFFGHCDVLLGKIQPPTASQRVRVHYAGRKYTDRLLGNPVKVLL